MLGAYTIKKIVPKLLVGVILINLSFYMVVGALDITRVVANGMDGLITDPFVNSTQGSYNFTLGDSVSGSQTALLIPLVGYGLYKALPVPATFTEMFKGTFRAKEGSRGGNVGQYLHALLFLVVIPIGLIFMAIFVTLVFRQGLILLLAITAPIACVLYILPGTEKYFKKWLDLFLKTLLVYPLIMLLFAGSDILASVIFNNNKGGLPALVAGLIAMFAPLALIPFAFKFAGGALGGIYGGITNGRAKIHEGFLKSNREKAHERMGDMYTQAQGTVFRRQNENLKTRGRTGRFVAGKMQGAIGQGFYAREGARNKRAAEQIQLETQFGDDTRVRAATAVYKSSPTGERDPATGRIKMGYYDLGGASYTKDEVMSARRSFGNNQYALQQNMAYGINKAMKESDGDNFMINIPELTDQLGISMSSMNGALVGAGFQMKAQDLQYKRLSVYKDKNTGETKVKFDAKGFVEEDYHSSSTWDGTAKKVDHWETMVMTLQENLRQLSVLEAVPVGMRNAQQQDDIMTLRTSIDMTKKRAETLKSQAASAGGYSQAYMMAMQQSGQQVAPGAAAGVSVAMEKLVTLAENVDISGPVTGVNTTVSQVLGNNGGRERLSSLRQEARELTTALAAPAVGGGPGLNSIEKMEAERRLETIKVERRKIMESSVKTLDEIRDIQQHAVTKANRRGYGYIDLGVKTVAPGLKPPGAP